MLVMLPGPFEPTYLSPTLRSLHMKSSNVPCLKMLTDGTPIIGILLAVAQMIKNDTKQYRP